MKKAVIYGFFRFPRMSANANYAQYLAQALMTIGYQVSIVSPGDISVCDKINGAYYHRGIEFIPIKLRKNKLLGYWDFHFGLGRLFVEEIKKINLQPRDLAIGYILDGSAIEEVHRYCKKRGVINIQCVDELFDDAHIKAMSFIQRYNYARAIDKSILECDYIFPISTFIDNYYASKGKKTFVIPILADINEFDNKHYEHTEAINIIYPANGMIKDSLTEMIKGIAGLPEDVLKKIIIHFTGIRCDFFQKAGLMGEYAKMQSTIVVHDWMEYEELIDLYRHMDFILLARETNQMTLANFPSKIPEAMTYGVVPIVSRVGDYTSFYLTNLRDSIVFDGSDAQACAEALKKAVVLDLQMRKSMSTQAQKTVENRFDYHVWADRMREFFREEEIL